MRNGFTITRYEDGWTGWWTRLDWRRRSLCEIEQKLTTVPLLCVSCVSWASCLWPAWTIAMLNQCPAWIFPIKHFWLYQWVPTLENNRIFRHQIHRHKPTGSLLLWGCAYLCESNMKDCLNCSQSLLCALPQFTTNTVAFVSWLLTDISWHLRKHD